MRKSKLLRVFSLVICCIYLLSSTAFAAPAETKRSSSAKFRYYYNQLATTESRQIYDLLEEMLVTGQLSKGNVSVDLVEEGVFQNTSNDKDVVMADFISARDAFMFDYNVFYVDFDKLSVSYSQSGTDYSIMMGIGRENTYLHDGFQGTSGAGSEIAQAGTGSKIMVDTAVADFDSKVSEMATKAMEEETLKAQVKAAYDAVVENVEYRLEAQADPENILYVRDPYGAIVKGQAVCEGYARALKAVLDQMGIQNVLVQGMFLDEDDFNKNGSLLEPHMWNYVKMDDNRWYQLDATMEDGDSSTDDEYFLLSGYIGSNVAEGDSSVTSLIDFYQPDGVISLSPLSREFIYPDLSPVDYVEMSKAFTITEDKKISYQGMGLSKTQEKTGKYILTSHNGTTWYYYDHLVQANLNVMGYVNEDGSLVTLKQIGMDFDQYFDDTFIQSAYLAITDIAPNQIFNPNDLREYYIYNAGLEYMTDVSKVGDVTEYEAVPPSIVTKLPYNSILKQGEKHDITVVYSEDLIKENSAKPAGIEWTKIIPGAEITNFVWHGDNTENPDPKKVTFTLKTVKSYAGVNHYYFDLANLMGKDSRAVPNKIHFSTVNNPTFACPKIPTNVNTIYSNTPALIADSNLEDAEWLDKDGKPMGENLPNRLALIASPLSGESADQYENQIDELLGEGETVAGSQTYDISLTLCSSQVAYITGRTVKVFVPFPEGYNGESQVIFKAYHYNTKAQKMEEIDCITTETGIIMLCNSFSPFTIAAVENSTPEKQEKKILLNTFGQGGIYESKDAAVKMSDLVTLEADSAKTLVIKADSGYKIESIKLNDILLDVANNKDMPLELNYDDLDAKSNILEVSFVALDETDEGGIPTYTAPVVNENLTYNGTEQALLQAGHSEHGTILYRIVTSEDEIITWSETVPAAKDAGDYTLEYMVKGAAGYDDVQAQRLHVNIAPKSIQASFAENSKVEKNYDGNNTVANLTYIQFVLSGIESGDSVDLDIQDSYGLYVNEQPGVNKLVTVYDLKINSMNYVLTNTTVSGNIGVINEVELKYTPPENKNALVYSGSARN